MSSQGTERYLWLSVIALALVIVFIHYQITRPRHCRDFSSWASAQQWSDAHGQVLDGNSNGFACEALLKK